MSRLICGIAWVLLLLMASPAADNTDAFTIWIPNLRISSGESVVSFEIDVTAGTIQSVSSLPIGWYFTIDNDASWQTKIKGNTTVGAASLKPEDFGKLRFLLKKNEFGDLKFGFTGTVSVTKDFQKERSVRLKMSDFGVRTKPLARRTQSRTCFAG